MKQLILANNGSIAKFNNIPEEIKRLYQTIWEIKQKWVLKAALYRGPFVDQTQSMNIFYGVPDYQKLYSSHMWSWRNGLKTGIYYLRTKPKAKAQQFTIDPSAIKKAIDNDDKKNEEDKKFEENKEDSTPVLACRRDNPNCEACGS